MFKSISNLFRTTHNRYPFTAKTSSVKGVSILFNKDNALRMDNLARLFSPKILKGAQGFWVVNQSEYESIKSVIVGMDEVTTCFMEHETPTDTFETLFAKGNVCPGKHWLMVYPDTPFDYKPGSRQDPNVLLSCVVFGIQATLSKPIEDNPDPTVIHTYAKPESTFIYANTAIAKLTPEILYLSSQTRVLNVGLSVGVPDITLPNVATNPDDLSILSANAKFKTFDTGMFTPIVKFGNSFDYERFADYLLTVGYLFEGSLFSQALIYDGGSGYERILIDPSGKVDAGFVGLFN